MSKCESAALSWTRWDDSHRDCGGGDGGCRNGLVPTIGLKKKRKKN